jgi:triosephosphate isomerase (TIM)
MRQLIAGNWKMHGLVEQLPMIEAICGASSQSLADILICPPFTLIARAAQIAAGRIAIGGQDCAITEAGPCTGDVSAEMLKDAGATAVILGHSERRHHHGETDQVVFAKAQAAAELCLHTIICIGETQSQRSAGTALKVCGEQIAASVPSQSDPSRLVVGYEPLWAIGTGHMPSADEIVEVHRHIRACLVAHIGAEASNVRILYGGSVNPSNAAAILRLPEVCGALVGGASLTAAEFTWVIEAVPPPKNRS